MTPLRLTLARALYRFVLWPALRSYWWLARPRTHGVRVIILSPGGDAVLLIRQAYGDRRRWGMPGGGYRPGREAPEDAARREVREETGLELAEVSPIGVLESSRSGNRDRLEVFRARALDTETRTSAEVIECRWMAMAEVRTVPLMRHAVRAFGLLNRQMQGVSTSS